MSMILVIVCLANYGYLIIADFFCNKLILAIFISLVVTCDDYESLFMGADGQQ